MLFCFIDESGSTGRNLDDTNQPIHHLVGVVVREDNLRRLSELMNDLLAQGPKGVTEFHAGEMFNPRSGVWSKVKPGDRINFMHRIINVLEEANGEVVHVSVNKAGLKANGDERHPHMIALQFLAEKVDQRLAQLRSEDPLDQRVLLVADENRSEEKACFDLIEIMKQQGGPVGYNAPTLDRFVENVYFVDSEQSNGVQVADCIAFIYNRYERVKRKPSSERTQSDQAVKDLHQATLPYLRKYRMLWPSSPNPVFQS